MRSAAQVRDGNRALKIRPAPGPGRRRDDEPGEQRGRPARTANSTAKPSNGTQSTATTAITSLTRATSAEGEIKSRPARCPTAAAWRVGTNTVAAIMAEQGLAARRRRRRRQTTRAGRGRWRAPDLVGRDFAAPALNHKWCGDGTEIGTDEGKLYLDSVASGTSAARRLSSPPTTPGWPALSSFGS